MTANRDLAAHLSGVRTTALVCGGAGSVLLVLGAIVDLPGCLRSYLSGVLLWISVAIGSLALMMIHNVTGGAWGHVTRRITSSAARTFPLLFVLFLPVLAGVGHLYEWTDSALMARDHHLHQKAAYLNVPFFVVRALVFFGLWTTLGTVMTRWSARSETGGEPHGQDLAERYSGPGLALLCVSATFAGIDWLMSLEPRWVSATYGLNFAVAGIVAAHAFQLVFVTRLPDAAASLPPGQLNDLGNFLLGFVMFWTYVTFSQFLIIWSGNIQEEVVYYLVRIRNGWSGVVWTVALAHFIVPFFLLLSPSNKRHLPTLARIALLVFIARAVDGYWLVQPVFRPAFHVSWMDVVAPVAVGGIWLWRFVGLVSERALEMTPSGGSGSHG